MNYEGVIPAKAGIQVLEFWIPAFAGMTYGDPAAIPQGIIYN